MSTQSAPFLTPEEYLQMERKAEVRSEYLNGRMFAMAGATLKHNRIVRNLVRDLANQLRGRECEVFATDLRLLVKPPGLFTYPDVMVICGPPRLAGDQSDTVTNPTLIIEVLSNSSKDYDRGEKFRFYRAIPEFAEYVLVAQDEMRLEHHVKQPDGSWLFRESTQRGAIVELPSIECRLSLDDVYQGVIPEP